MSGARVRHQFPMFTLTDLEDLRSECFADDVQITPEAAAVMATWSADQCRAWFEDGGPASGLLSHVLIEARTTNAFLRPWKSETLVDGQVAVHIVRLAFTANALTYCFCGGPPLYTLSNFPVPDGLLSKDVDTAPTGYGRCPCWGVGIVSTSRCPGVPVGERIYGFFPMSPTAVLQPVFVQRKGGLSFVDGNACRKDVIVAYKTYADKPLMSTKPGRELSPDEEDFHHACGSVFATGWSFPFCAAQLERAPDAIVITAASSRTSIAGAFASRFHSGVLFAEVIGLTSQERKGYVASLNVYDEVVTYEELEDRIDSSQAMCIFDVAGSAELMRRLYAHLGASIVDYQKVGVAHLGAQKVESALFSDAAAHSPPGAVISEQQPSSAGATAAPAAEGGGAAAKDFNVWPVLRASVAKHGVHKHTELLQSCWEAFKADIMPKHRVERAHGPAQTLKTFQRVVDSGCEPNCAYSCSLWPEGQQEPTSAADVASDAVSVE